MTRQYTERELLERSEEMKQNRQDFLINYMNPHEKQNRQFINEVIEFYDIQTLEEFNYYKHLMPDCVTRLFYQIEFEKQK